MLQSPRKMSTVGRTAVRQTSKPSNPEVVLTSTHEKTDFVKFTKFLALKAVQIIIDSRKGVKVETKCKTHSSDVDWFNLAIQESAEVTKATKKVLHDDVLSTFISNLCVEISLRTSDDDEMILETWTLGLDQSQVEPSLKAMSTVYYRMGILLKSLISVSRITPAYKLSRRQGSDSYKILYQIYTGASNVDTLGDDRKEVRVGQLKTPLGAIFIKLAYRTNMTISPNTIQKYSSLVVKSDHFELSPKHVIYSKSKKVKKKEEKVLDLTKPLRTAAFVDPALVEQILKEFSAKLPSPIRRSPYRKPVKSDILMCSNNTQEHSKGDSLTKEKPPQKFSKIRNTSSQLKLLHCPFADPNPIRELAEFYKDFFNAPTLNLSLKPELFDQNLPLYPRGKIPEVEPEVELPKQLEDFESLGVEFDDMLATMHCSDESA